MSPGRCPSHPLPNPAQSNNPTAAMISPNTTNVFPTSFISSTLLILIRVVLQCVVNFLTVATHQPSTMHRPLSTLHLVCLGICHLDLGAKRARTRRKHIPNEYFFRRRVSN